MWFSRRRRDEPEAGPVPETGSEAAARSAPARPAPAAGGDPGRPSRDPARQDWAAVATIQPSATGLDRTIDTRFDRDLSSWQSPAVLRPLDHALSGDAPSGLVLDSIARSALPP